MILQTKYLYNNISIIFAVSEPPRPGEVHTVGHEWPWCCYLWYQAQSIPQANHKRNVYLYKRADMEGLRRKLKERFELFEASRPETKSIRANWDQFKADIYNSINEFIPQQTLKNKRSLPWCNANIRPLIRKKQRCYNSACRNGKEQVWCRFRNLHKLVHKELQLPHQKYVNNLLDIDEADPVHDHAKAGITKCFWQYIKAKRKLRWNCYLEITWQGISQNPRRKQTS